MIRGIRGAITVDSNTESAIKEATLELLKEMLSQNNVKTDDIAYAFFTMTKDLNKVYPAKFARENLDFQFVPMMCFDELDIENSLKMCLRIMLSVNSSKAQKEIKHIYLKGASVLRKDLVK